MIFFFSLDDASRTKWEKPLETLRWLRSEANIRKKNSFIWGYYTIALFATATGDDSPQYFVLCMALCCREA